MKKFFFLSRKELRTRDVESYERGRQQGHAEAKEEASNKIKLAEAEVATLLYLLARGDIKVPELFVSDNVSYSSVVDLPRGLIGSYDLVRRYDKRTDTWTFQAKNGVGSG